MRSQTLVATVAVVVIGAYLLFGRTGPVVSSADAFPDAVSAVDGVTSLSDPVVLIIHVSGAVVAPGVVELKPDARVADAVAAAGGATRDADLSAINLADQVSDGAQIVVPAYGDAPDGGAGEPAPSGVIDLNAATVAELLELPGIGPVLAQRIVRHREQYGPFVVLEDVLDVAGIGEARLAELRDLAGV